MKVIWALIGVAAIACALVGVYAFHLPEANRAPFIALAGGLAGATLGAAMGALTGSYNRKVDRQKELEAWGLSFTQAAEQVHYRYNQAPTDQRAVEEATFTLMAAKSQLRFRLNEDSEIWKRVEQVHQCAGRSEDRKTLKDANEGFLDLLKATKV